MLGSSDSGKFHSEMNEFGFSFCKSLARKTKPECDSDDCSIRVYHAILYV